MASTSNKAASAPLTLRSLVPCPSSVTITSATRTRAEVSKPSDRIENALPIATDGASFASATATENAALSSMTSPTVASFTFTTASRLALLSKFRTDPALRNSSDPSISNRLASAPVIDSVSGPSASSVITISAILIRAEVSALSSMLVSTLASATLGASFTSVTASVSDTLSSGLLPTAASSTETVTLSDGSVSKSSAAPALR